MFVSQQSYSSVLSDKMSGKQTQSTTKPLNTGDKDPNKTNQLTEEKKQIVVKNPKIDEFMGLSTSKIKLFFGITVVIGFFIFGFGRFILTGKQ
jgi:hypothetical protein